MSLPEKPKILVVDDKPENLLSMEVLFDDEPCDIVTAKSGNDALGHMVNQEFALVLLDVQMPGMDGFETAELMRSNNRTKEIPIIFVTAINKDTRHIFRGYESGAVDYIFKPLDPVILKSKTRVFLQLYNQKKRLEEANKKIIEQQKSVIEEERLKVLLEMAGATAHELNQPLMALLGSIELIGMCKGEPEEIEKSLTRIKESGKRISEVIRKIQNIRHYDVKAHDTKTQVINLEQPVKILYIEDLDEDYTKIRDLLDDEPDITIEHAKSLSEGLEILSGNRVSEYDIIFLDFLLGDGTGFEFLEEVEKRGSGIPVVIITQQSDEVVAAQLIQSGACEYLSKGRVDKGTISRVIQKARTHQRLHSDMKRLQDRLVETSVKDELTGLYNRRFFMEAFTAEFQRAKRHQRELAVLIIDIDHFKPVNDTYGHLAGDDVLSTIAKQLLTCMRRDDLIGRYGGEEFAVILPETDLDGAYQAGEKMRAHVESLSFKKINPHVKITISVGAATIDSHEEPRDMIGTADMAMYEAKQSGRNKVVANKR